MATHCQVSYPAVGTLTILSIKQRLGDYHQLGKVRPEAETAISVSQNADGHSPGKSLSNALQDSQILRLDTEISFTPCSATKNVATNP